MKMLLADQVSRDSNVLDVLVYWSSWDPLSLHIVIVGFAIFGVTETPLRNPNSRLWTPVKVGNLYFQKWTVHALETFTTSVWPVVLSGRKKDSR